MTKSPESSSGTSPKGQASKDACAERQAKALRDNLRRRKQQARGRDGGRDGGRDANGSIPNSDSLESSDKPE